MSLKEAIGTKVIRFETMTNAQFAEVFGRKHSDNSPEDACLDKAMIPIMSAKKKKNCCAMKIIVRLIKRTITFLGDQINDRLLV